MRQAYFVVDADILVELCRGEGPRNFTRLLHGFPNDATIERMGHDSFGRLNIVLTSASFPDIRDDEPLTRLPSPVFEKIAPPSINDLDEPGYGHAV